MNRKSLLLLSGVMMGLVTISAFLFSIPITAQEVPGVTSVPGEQEQLPITLEPTLAAQHAATDVAQATQDALWQAEFDSRTIFDFRIAYLIAQNAIPSQSVVSAEAMQEVLGAITAHSWEDVMRLNDQQPLNMLLIHVSMVDAVDRAWTSWAYRNNVFLVGINTREQQLAEIAGDQCRRFAKKELLDYFENTYLYFEYFVSLADEAQRDFVNTSVLEDCIDDYHVGREERGFILVGNGTFRYPIRQKEDLEMLRTTLVVATVNQRIPKPGLISVPNAPDTDMMRGSK